MLRERKLSFWFWVALVAIVTNPIVLQVALDLSHGVLRLLGGH